MFMKIVEGKIKKMSAKMKRNGSGAYKCHAAAAESRSSLPKVQGKGKQIG